VRHPKATLPHHDGLESLSYFSVFHDSLANSGSAFTNVFTETTHAAAECSARVKRPAVFHVLAKTPSTMTDAQARLCKATKEAVFKIVVDVTEVLILHGGSFANIDNCCRVAAR